MSLMTWLGLAAAVVGCELVGIVGALFTTRTIPTWYRGLRKPRLNPPNWIFGPVWTVLYAMMGVSLWLAWRAGAPELTLLAFFGQLILNFLWTPLFFGAHWIRIALFDLLALWLSIVATIALFMPVSLVAAWLLVPYLLWVTFATYLNWAIVKLN